LLAFRLKQSSQTWYTKFQIKTLAKGFTNAEIAPCLFIKCEGNRIIIVAIYVDDPNLFGIQNHARNNQIPETGI
jgi:hypothetical protein